VITLHDLNNHDARAVVREAPVILFVNPHTGWKHVVSGGSIVEAAQRSGDERVPGVQISVEDEGFERELATAAVLAIRGHVDDASAECLRSLSETILKYWSQDLPVPWTEMLSR
jgi:hypothetical protein